MSRSHLVTLLLEGKWWRYKWICGYCGKTVKTQSPSRAMQLSIAHGHINEAFERARLSKESNDRQKPRGA